MLSEEQTHDFINLAKNGDERAKTELISGNISLIKSIIKRYLNKGVDYDDLFQLASMGFLKAIYNFDFSFNVKFSTYAVPMIAGEIKRFMRDDGSIKVSRSIKFTAKCINKFIEEETFKTGSAPTIEKIAQKFKIDKTEAVFIMDSNKMPISIFGQAEYKDEKDKELIEKLPSKDNQEELIEKIQLKNAISKLNEREKKIVILRYFRDMTQSEVAGLIGVSQVQISRIETKIMEQIKQDMTG